VRSQHTATIPWTTTCNRYDSDGNDAHDARDDQLRHNSDIPIVCLLYHPLREVQVHMLMVVGVGVVAMVLMRYVMVIGDDDVAIYLLLLLNLVCC
jgi:hypothetical protein